MCAAQCFSLGRRVWFFVLFCFFLLTFPASEAAASACLNFLGRCGSVLWSDTCGPTCSQKQKHSTFSPKQNFIRMTANSEISTTDSVSSQPILRGNHRTSTPILCNEQFTSIFAPPRYIWGVTEHISAERRTNCSGLLICVPFDRRGRK